MTKEGVQDCDLLDVVGGAHVDKGLARTIVGVEDLLQQVEHEVRRAVRLGDLEDHGRHRLHRVSEQSSHHSRVLRRVPFALLNN